jgi:hypothetical protein
VVVRLAEEAYPEEAVVLPLAEELLVVEAYPAAVA